jgi:predicted component of type VI protein secretion system
LERLAQLEAKEKEREEASKTETEKLAQRAAKAEQDRDAAIAEREAAQTALQTERIKNAVIAEASKLGFADPDDAYTLVTLSEIEIDDAGKVNGAAEAIKKLAEAKPYLLGQARKGDGVGTPKTPPKKKEESIQKRTPIIRSL